MPTSFPCLMPCVGSWHSQNTLSRSIKESREQYQIALEEMGIGAITTEIKTNQPYFLAEEYHQQYLDKNPNGYCGIGGTGCEFKI